MKEKHVKHLWVSCVLLIFLKKYDSENIIFFELIAYLHIKYMCCLHIMAAVICIVSNISLFFPKIFVWRDACYKSALNHVNYIYFMRYIFKDNVQNVYIKLWSSFYGLEFIFKNVIYLCRFSKYKFAHGDLIFLIFLRDICEGV